MQENGPVGIMILSNQKQDDPSGPSASRLRGKPKPHESDLDIRTRRMPFVGRPFASRRCIKRKPGCSLSSRIQAQELIGSVAIDRSSLILILEIPVSKFLVRFATCFAAFRRQVRIARLRNKWQIANSRSGRHAENPSRITCSCVCGSKCFVLWCQATHQWMLSGCCEIVDLRRFVCCVTLTFRPVWTWPCMK